jgi:hypothetical protein
MVVERRVRRDRSWSWVVRSDVVGARACRHSLQVVRGVERGDASTTRMFGGRAIKEFCNF